MVVVVLLLVIRRGKESALKSGGWLEHELKT
jgi:hypothetical protein